MHTIKNCNWSNFHNNLPSIANMSYIHTGEIYFSCNHPTYIYHIFKNVLKLKCLNKHQRLANFWHVNHYILLQRSDVQLSERLASLGIMGAQLRAPLKPPVHHSTIILSKWKCSFFNVCCGHKSYGKSYENHYSFQTNLLQTVSSHSGCEF